MFLKMAAVAIALSTFTGCGDLAEALEVKLNTINVVDQYTIDIREDLKDVKDSESDKNELEYENKVTEVYISVDSDPIAAILEEGEEEAAADVLSYASSDFKDWFFDEEAKQVVEIEETIQINGLDARLLIFEEVYTDYSWTYVTAIVKGESDIYTIYARCDANDDIVYKDDLIKMVKSLKILSASEESKQYNADSNGDSEEETED